MFTRIKQGQDLVIGGRKFKVLTGDGHAIEQVMLYLPEEDLFFLPLTRSSKRSARMYQSIHLNKAAIRLLIS